MEPRTVANSPKPPCAASLKDLINQLHRVFEDDHINVEYVHELMSSYRSNPKEWQQYAKFDRHSQFDSQPVWLMTIPAEDMASKRALQVYKSE
ncbi:hypothetical protein HPB51_015250 [Rhipicephalus microplus]|uniref:Cysteine dioxygenase n=1 Tax=Rhipicephalus microplus TaxID=6941 RepID=A0A9J6DNU4_RHIMP|nr:hypothetical protein HPB51_015250 [Rhipicephalus microplus]